MLIYQQMNRLFRYAGIYLIGSTVGGFIGGGIKSYMTEDPHSDTHNTSNGRRNEILQHAVVGAALGPVIGYSLISDLIRMESSKFGYGFARGSFAFNIYYPSAVKIPHTKVSNETPK